MMLSIQHRMRRSVEFGTTVRRGVRVGRPLVVVHIDHSRSHDEGRSSAVSEPARVGFVVSRGVGGAVVRNAVRRRLRHLMADRLADLPAGARVVVRARPEAAHSPSSALGRDLDSALAAARSRLEVGQ